MKLKYAIAAVSILFLISMASAVPTTLPATLVGPNNFTMNAAGTATPFWFVWGLAPGNEAWRTPNINSGSSYTQQGSPLYSSTTYYYRAVDATGMGNERFVVTAAVTPMPTITLDVVFNNMTESGFNPLIIAQNSLLPYQWLQTPIAIIFAWIFMVIFIGIWIRTRSVSVVSFVGMLASGGIVLSSAGLQLPLPRELIQVSQMILYITVTACIIVLVKK